MAEYDWGGDYDRLFSLQETTDGSFIIAGNSKSNISGDKNENCFGNWDYWIMKLDENYNLVTGKLFADLNSNGIQDSGNHHYK
ncbi:MAG: hypothetical protein IPO63_13180 [Bacteroidetes bacterium]|nr:hypothetical protein [Bacteroidota bacterium]